MVLEGLEHKLKGERGKLKEDKKIGVYIEWEEIKGVTPLLNEKGISYLLTLLTPIVDKNVSTSKFTFEEKNKLVRRICKDAAFNLWASMDEFGLSEENYDAVNDIVLTLVIALFNQALDGGLRGLLGRTISSNETIVREKEKNRGFFRLPF